MPQKTISTLEKFKVATAGVATARSSSLDASGVAGGAVSEDEVFAETVTTMARHIAAGPPIALGFMKQNINTAIDGTLRENLMREADCLTRCAVTDDHKEAVAAFLEKRSPEFHGK